MTDETRDLASSPDITSTSLYSLAGGMARKTTHERYLGRRRSYRSEELTTNGASPRRAELWVCGDWKIGHDTRVDGKQAAVSMERPRRPAVCPEMTLVRTLVWSLASSSLVPGVPWDALEELKVTCSVHLPGTLSETSPM
eukprot:scaffold37449_cov59-Phaeocystis_antarctica.AAC.1